MNDHSVVNWLYTTVNKGVFDIVYKPNSSAYTIWNAIEGLFRDNELQRAVYLEAELRTLQQGDMSITDYCTRLKTLADSLRDLDQPISEPSQVLNLLRGLNPRYRQVKPVITAKFPPHTFMSARSYLLLEELCDKHDAKVDAGQAFYAAHRGDSSTGNTDHANHAGRNGGQSGSDASRNKPRNKKRGRGSGAPGNGASSASSSGGAPIGSSSAHQHQPPPGLPWTAGYNPWTGLVQAWPMPFRTPGAPAMAPRPPFQVQHTMTAFHHPALPAPPAATTPTWDGQALLTALQNNGGQPQPPPSSADWYMDTGASAHMSNAPGNLTGSTPLPHPSSIIVGNGARLTVSHSAAASIPTVSSSIQLNNVLISPSLVTNLISVRKLTRDNNVSVEFDPHGSFPNQ